MVSAALLCQIERNALFGASMRLLMAIAFTAITFCFAFLGASPYLRPFAFLYLAFTAVSAGALVAVRRSRFARLHHFWLLPFLDIPVVTIERWCFLPHAHMPSGVGLIALTYFLTFIALSLFSLDRRVILVTTAAGLLMGGVLLWRSQTVKVLIPTGLCTLALAGAASYVALGRMRELLEAEAERAGELRHLLAHVDAAREADRTRLSRDLHDELGEQLGALGYALALTDRRVQAGATAIAANLKDMQVQLSRTRALVRTIAVDLRPPLLDELGLREALDWLLRRVSERAALETTLSFTGDEGRLDDARRTAVFRIVQEALTNVTRHAGARSVQVSVASAAVLSLSVTDDGSGFDPALPRSGVGLMGMRERARALGGTFAVHSRPGAGTTLRLTLPLEAAAMEEVA